ncbi:TolC family protein [Bathymodiolus septemdierum thioautotrophic gill symbiont]|uniref:RND family efflux pump outer membrane protein n=1 Tax=endosymbiont of Bathymodiolus septemdierum str. Myojin knoll TaxID=1303921 RepID=A0A0P0US01_9GAMM|nr:TolC family protein [Bathymodiolus septemdierum thioautotrophic gill symbiont]BAS68019.1 RND family efflux pump outer membrane protein [endosymbiont of Bathymodiolus septemdierum str. Myojin knoll]
MLLRYLSIFLLISFSLSVNAKANNYSLGGLVDMALNYHPSIVASVRLQNAAEQGVDAAEWQYFPTPSLSVSQVKASETDTNFNGNNRVIKLGLTQPLWSGGSLDADLEKAEAELEIKKSQSLIARRDLALKVINSYSTWLASYLKLKAYRSSKEEHQSLKERIKRRIKQGLSSGSDLALVSSRLLQVKSSLNSAEIRHKNSLLQLEESVGKALDLKNIVANISADYPVKGELQSLLANALIIDPQLIGLHAKIKSLRATHKASKASLQPLVNLKLERQWGNFNNKNAKAENRVYIDLVSRFGAGLSSFSKIKQAKFEQQSSEFEIKSIRDSLKQKFEGEWLSVKSLIKQKAILSDALIASKKIQKSWYRQFLAGRKQWQDVMNAIREVAQLESQLADATAESLLISWRMGIRINGVLKLVHNDVPPRSFIETGNEKLLDDDSPITTSKTAKMIPDKPIITKEIVQAPKLIRAIKKVENSSAAKVESIKQLSSTKQPVVKKVEKTKVITSENITVESDLKTGKSTANRVVWRPSKQGYKSKFLDLNDRPLKPHVVKLPIAPANLDLFKLKILPKMKIHRDKKVRNEKNRTKIFWRRHY